MLLDANKLGAFGLLLMDRMQLALGELSPSAAALLSMLYFKPGLSGSELAVIADVAQPTAVRLLDGLVRQGLAERGEQQGRSTPLVLTMAGRARAQALQAARLKTLSGLLDALPAKERQCFELLMDRILAGATTSRAFARTTCRLCEHDLCSSDVCPVGRKAAEIEQAKGEGE